MPAVYAAGSLSLAVLEVLVHVDTDLISNDFVAFAVDIANDLPSKSIILDELPENWRDEYPPEYCRQLGDRWLRAGTAAILWVPSAIIPNETNAILNPRHEDFRELAIYPAESFQFDHRLWRPVPLRHPGRRQAVARQVSRQRSGEVSISDKRSPGMT
jgi:RES domain-containing protein